MDGHYEGTTLTRLAFGSCNKQWRNNTLWEPIVAFGPQAYLWLGDAVYVKEREGDNEANLRRAYTRQLASPGYKRLLATGAVVEGVYDDHDMSTNDGHRVVRCVALRMAGLAERIRCFSPALLYKPFTTNPTNPTPANRTTPRSGRRRIWTSWATWARTTPGGSARGSTRRTCLGREPGRSRSYFWTCAPSRTTPRSFSQAPTPMRGSPSSPTGSP